MEFPPDEPESSRAGGEFPAAVDGVPPDPNTMFPRPDAGDIEQKKNASVGIEDPRKEVGTPGGIRPPLQTMGSIPRSSSYCRSGGWPACGAIGWDDCRTTSTACPLLSS